MKKGTVFFTAITLLVAIGASLYVLKYALDTQYYIGYQQAIHDASFVRETALGYEISFDGEVHEYIK